MDVTATTWFSVVLLGSRWVFVVFCEAVFLSKNLDIVWVIFFQCRLSPLAVEATFCLPFVLFLLNIVVRQITVALSKPAGIA